MPDQVVLRRWTGKVATERTAEYAKYVGETGIEEIEADTASGKLDTLADKALAAHRSGRTRAI